MPMNAVKREIKKAGGAVCRAVRRFCRPAFLYDTVGTLVTALLLVSLVFTFVFRQVTVVGDSMNDTLSDEDRLLVSCLFYFTPKQGDIVIINRYTEEPLIKRVIAVAGQSVGIDPVSGAVLVDSEPLDEPYIHYENLRYDLKTTVVVPDGYVFVMGDHRDNSLDSRTDTVGFIDVRDIVGKAFWRIRPLSEWGFLY